MPPKKSILIGEPPPIITLFVSNVDAEGTFYSFYYKAVYISIFFVFHH